MTSRHKADLERSFNTLHHEPEGARRLGQFFSREQAAAECLRAKRERRLERIIRTIHGLLLAMLAAVLATVWTRDAWAFVAVCALGAAAAVLFLAAVLLACRLDDGSRP